jgi:hypothetical protein
MVFDNAPDVAEQIFTAWFVQHTFAVFGRENDVIDDLRVGGHVLIDGYVRPLQGRKSFRIFRGFHPR